MKRVCKLLPNAHKDDFPEEILSLSLRDAESPRAAADVAPIFPDGFDAAFEEVDRVFEFESVEGEVVHYLPEELRVGDVVLEEGEAVCVGG